MNESFCHGKFWDFNETWNNEVPEFSSCFQDTVFIIFPCALFFAILIFSICKITGLQEQMNPLPWTWFNLLKVSLSVLLAITRVFQIGHLFQLRNSGENVPYSTLISTFSQMAIYILTVITMLKHRSYGVKTSTAMSSFWLFHSLCSAVVCRSFIIHMDTPGINFTMNVVHYFFLFSQLVLSVFVDKHDSSLLQERNVMDEISLLSFLTFQWFTKIVYKSWKKNIIVQDLSFLNLKLTARYVYAAFSKNWNFYLTPEPNRRSSLGLSLMKSFWTWILTAAALNLFFLISLLLPPLLLDRIINFTHDDVYPWRGYFFAVLIFITDFVGKTVQNVALHYMFGSTVQFQSCLMGAIFRKNLCLSTAARKEYNSGTLMSLLSVDVKRVQLFGFQVASIVNAPVKILVIVYLLWRYIGPATIAGVVVVVLLLPISCFVSRFGDKFAKQQMDAKDIRLKHMNEFLNGIKILKLYAWEIPFAEKVTEARKKEIHYIRYNLFCYVMATFAYFCAPFMVSLASFTTYLMLDSNNILDPVTAFVSLTLINQLRYALFELPDSITELVQCNISLGRLRKFFNAENMDENAVGSNTESEEVLTIKDASLSWDKDSDSVLRGISLNVPKHALVAIIGPVGSGKSSLLSAVLGEMHKISGSIDIKGSMAYVPQQPWVLNRTLKRNILLVKNMAEEKYNRILEHCCLKPDLESLPAGDNTEIGEKGVNLSGGQKLRVNLAQAVYQDRDIYLLDDPLSAVDVHVRKALFKNIIGRSGLLRKKTRLLVTHDTSVLPEVDLIVSMKNGRIEEIGTYEELLNQNGSFTHFMDEHSIVEPVESTSEDSLSTLRKHRSLQRTLSRASGKSIGEDSSRGDHLELDEDWKSFKIIDEEEMEVGGVNRTIYWKYVKCIGIPLFMLSTFWYIAYTAFNTGATIWVSKWSEDIALNGTQDASTTAWRLSIYGLLGFSQVVCVVLASSLMIYGTTRASSKYHNNMLQNIMKSPMSFFDSTPLGRIINRFTTDLDILDVAIFYKLNAWMSCLFATIAAFIIIGINTPVFIAALVPLGVIYYSMQKLHLNTFRQARRLETTTRSLIYSLFMESIHGVSSISAYKVKEDFIQNFEEKIDFNCLCLFNNYSCDRWLNFWLNTLGSVIVLVASLLAVDHRDTLSPATVGLLVTYALAVTEALKWFMRMNSELEDNSISVERVDEYCHLTSEAPWTVDRDEGQEDWLLNGDITFSNYSTKYRENMDLVLKEINLSVKASEKVGVVGRTGAGKSSFTLALFRIIEPTFGTIFIDDIDITTLGLHDLRSKLTIIPQDPVLFTGSLRSNLDPNGEHNDEEIWESLQKSYLKTFVLNLNEGLEYKLEENGSNFSAGQRQLVCLARALLKNSKILVLDEATAAIDIETDNLIQSTIRTAFEDRTVITIAHRLNTVLDYDKIVVMESGSVVEFGNPKSLIQDTESRFHKMNKEAGLI